MKHDVVCRCEEVARDEIRTAIENGFDSVSWVKRVTRAGMGTCQGKTCGRLLARMLQQDLGRNAASMVPDSVRPPVRPIPLRVLAESYSGFREVDYPVYEVDRHAYPLAGPAPGEKAPFGTKAADVVVVGAGSTGCAVAYFLAKRGVRVAVVDRAQVAFEGGGRNMGGIRQLGRHPAEIPMAIESVKRFRNLSAELGADIEFREMGYLWLACNENEWSLIRKVARSEQEMGVDVHILENDALHSRFPSVSAKAVGGAFCPSDSFASPVKTCRAYAAAAEKSGAAMYMNTTVTGVSTSAGRVSGVITDRGEIKAGVVVNAAGPWGKALADMVGVELPIRPCPNQIMVTEPVPPTLSPLMLSTGCVSLQGPFGNMYVGNTNPPAGFWGFDKRTNRGEMARTARNFLEIVPSLADAKVIRSWVGILDHTPDDIPIIGEEPQVPGFIEACGFSGHGFALTPVLGQVISEYICGDEPAYPLRDFRPERFTEGIDTTVEHFAHQDVL
ncbi:MAG: FAD-dependent oxidoreductase [Ignavibacteriales bacterium]